MNKSNALFVFIVACLLAACGFGATPPGIDANVPVVKEVTRVVVVTATPQSQPTATSASMPTPTPSATSTSIVAPQPTVGLQPVEVDPNDTDDAYDKSTDALIALGRNGVVSMLTKNGWQRHRLPDATSCYTGKILAQDAFVMIDCGGRLFYSTNGQDWSQFENFYSGSAAVDSKGNIWVVQGEQLFVKYMDGNTRVFRAAQSIQSARFPDKAITFDENGVLWLAGNGDASQGDKFVVRANPEKNDWQGYAADAFVSSDGKSVKFFYPSQIISGKSAVIVFDTGGRSTFVLRPGKDKFIEEKISDFFEGILPITSVRINGISLMPDDTPWYATSRGIINGDGKNYVRLLDTRAGLPATNVYKTLRDKKDRLWVATEFGVAMLVEDWTLARGHTATDLTWRVATMSDSGLGDSDIVAIGEKGTLNLPPPMSQKKTTVVSGRIVRKGEPLAGADVFLCSGTATRDLSTDAAQPCELNSVRIAAVLDTQGRYRFNQVPIGTYTLVVRKQKETWSPYYHSDTVDARKTNKEVLFDVNFN